MQILTTESRVKAVTPLVVKKSLSPDMQKFAACRKIAVRAIEYYLKNISTTPDQYERWEKVGKIRFQHAYDTAKGATTYQDIIEAVQAVSSVIEIWQGAGFPIKVESTEGKRELREMCMLIGIVAHGSEVMRQVAWNEFC